MHDRSLIRLEEVGGDPNGWRGDGGMVERGVDEGL